MFYLCLETPGVLLNGLLTIIKIMRIFGTWSSIDLSSSLQGLIFLYYLKHFVLKAAQQITKTRGLEELDFCGLGSSSTRWLGKLAQPYSQASSIFN